MNALKKADTFTVRFEDWDLPCYGWGRYIRRGDPATQIIRRGGFNLFATEGDGSPKTKGKLV